MKLGILLSEIHQTDVPTPQFSKDRRQIDRIHPSHSVYLSISRALVRGALELLRVLPGAFTCGAKDRDVCLGAALHAYATVD